MKTIVIGTAGHIDHGKSTLVKAMTGTDPDRLKEEQARGITIDLGFAHVTHGATRIAFVDVPGHERFVRNMLAGAGGIDAVLLVIDANEGVRPQTREHFQICRLLGLDRGVVALTKTDSADQATIGRAREGAMRLVAGSFLDGAGVVEVSARTGTGLNELAEARAALAGRPARQDRPGIVRLPIDRAFAMKGFGAVVTGTLVSGRIALGDSVAIFPAARTSRVRGIQVHGQKVGSAAAPDRVAVNLADLDTRELRRGQTIATEGSLAMASRIDVEIEAIADAPPLRHGARVRVHAGSSETGARLSIAATRATPAAAWVRVRPGDAGVEVAPGAAAFARLRLESPLAATRGDRLILRAGSPTTTIGGARVLDPEPALAGVRREASLERFQELARPEAPVTAFLRERAEFGLGVQDLVRRGGLDRATAVSVIERLIAEGAAVRIAEHVVAVGVVERWESAVLAALQDFHRGSPLEPGLGPAAIRDRGRQAPAEFVGAVVERLKARGVIRGSDRIALASHAPTVSASEQALRGTLEQMLREGALAPPDRASLAGLADASPAEVDRAIQWLLLEKRVVRAGGLLFHQEALAALRLAVGSLRQGTPAGGQVTLDVGTFKARFGLTRKHAIPLLEWLDRERVTRRTGDVRVVL